MVGRATRIFEGKEFARIIDFNHTTDMDLIGPSSLAELPESVAREVEKITKKEKEVDLWEAVERAKDTIHQREMLQVQVARLEMQYRRVEVDPFVCSKNLGVRVDMTMGPMATEAQCRALTRFKVPNPEGMTKKQASRLLSTLIERSSANLATVGQVNCMISLGVKPHTARNMTFKEASETISRLLGRR